MSASKIVDALLEADEDVDPKDYVGLDPYPGVSIEPVPGGNDTWAVYFRRTHHFLGTLTFDDQGDMPPEAHPNWKGANWIASPISPSLAIKAFNSKDEAMAYLMYQ